MFFFMGEVVDAVALKLSPFSHEKVQTRNLPLEMKAVMRCVPTRVPKEKFLESKKNEWGLISGWIQMT